MTSTLASVAPILGAASCIISGSLDRSSATSAYAAAGDFDSRAVQAAFAAPLDSFESRYRTSDFGSPLDRFRSTEPTGCLIYFR